MTNEQKLYIDNKLVELADLLNDNVDKMDVPAFVLTNLHKAVEVVGDIRQYISDEDLLSKSNPPTRIVRVDSPWSISSLADSEIKSIYPAPEYGNQAFRVHFENGSNEVVFNATSIVEQPIT